MGKKYIIEMEDTTFRKTRESGAETYLWRVKGFNSLVFDSTGISKLTPYTEPDIEQVKADAYNDGYKAGREAEKVRHPDLEQVRKQAYAEGFKDGRYAERNGLIASYAQEQEEIKVGDEVGYYGVANEHGDVCYSGVVLEIREEDYLVMEKTGKTYTLKKKLVMSKTGRHFPEIVKVLEKMRGENND